MRTFLTEFSDYLESIITAPGKLIIGGGEGGNSKIHIDDGNDANAKQFLDLLQGFGLINQFWLPTHISGHTLDLIITNNEIAVQSTQTRNYISDHCFVKVVTTIDKPEVQTKEIRFRKLGEIIWII